MRKKYRYFDPEKAREWERREATRRAVDSGVMESPVVSLARAMGRISERENKLEKGISAIHREFEKIKEDVINSLPKTARAKSMENVLRSEENIVSEFVNVFRP